MIIWFLLRFKKQKLYERLFIIANHLSRESCNNSLLNHKVAALLIFLNSANAIDI